MHLNPEPCTLHPAQWHAAPFTLLSLPPKKIAHHIRARQRRTHTHTVEAGTV